jgi:hypothetical protein
VQTLARRNLFRSAPSRNNQICYKCRGIAGDTYTGAGVFEYGKGYRHMSTFQTAVNESLEVTEAKLESLVVADDAMSLGYRVPSTDDREAVTEQIAAVASAFLLAVRDGAGRPQLTVHIYEGDAPVPTASYCIDADWARSCVLGDSEHSEYLQRVLDTLASREQLAAGKVSFVEA